MCTRKALENYYKTLTNTC